MPRQQYTPTTLTTDCPAAGQVGARAGMLSLGGAVLCAWATAAAAQSSPAQPSPFSLSTSANSAVVDTTPLPSPRLVYTEPASQEGTTPPATLGVTPIPTAHGDAGNTVTTGSTATSPAATRFAPLQRLGRSLQGLWAQVQSHLPWHPDGHWFGSPEAPRGTRDALLAELGSRRTLNGLGGMGFMLYSQEAAEGSVRASAGLLRSETGNWWQTHSERYSGLSASYLRLSASGVLSSASSQVPCDLTPARPYLGASFSSQLTPSRAASSWRLNADLGLVSMGNTTGRNSLALNPERSLDDNLRDMRLRPNVKVSVGYSF